MNFLNPFALLGLVAAGIPILLHLLNLRKLRTMDFSTLRFLKQIQETRVRRLKLQQILLLILRTLLIVFAVLAFARPSIPTNLPLLTADARASVVILIDNSASMEGADGAGQRFRQAQDAAHQIISMLKDGDEVSVLPLAGVDEQRLVGFTRTFAEADAEVERISINEGRADIPSALSLADALFQDALHAHHEVYIVSDAQRVNVERDGKDTAVILRSAATVFAVRIGDGLSGLEQNLSVDSVHLVTRLFQPNRPLEVEAFIRNGSERDATGVVCSMAFDKVRVAQRALDIPAGETRSVIIASPPQRRGMVAVSIELDDDAIDGDNARFIGVTIPHLPRIAVVGTGLGADLATTALQLQGTVDEPTQIRRFAALSDVMPALSTLDVVFLINGTWKDQDVDVLAQFVERGGGFVCFAQDDERFPALLAPYGLLVGEVKKAEGTAGWKIRDIDEGHALFAGVFKSSRERQVVESPRIVRQRPAVGGITVASADAGAFISEGSRGAGRVIYAAIGLDGSWGPFGATGLFAATMVRASLYTTMPRDQGLDAKLGETVTAPVPGRFVGEPSYLMTDPQGTTTTLAPARLPSSTVLTFPPQRRPGVVKLQTYDSVAVMTVAYNAPMEESLLDLLDDDQWEGGLGTLVTAPERIVAARPGNSMMKAVQSARTGAELWPLFIILAVLCAVADSLVGRFMAQDREAAVSP